MFKVKLWITVLLYVVAGAFLIVLGTPKLHDALLPPLERRVESAVRAVEANLVLDSSASLTAAAQLTALPLVRDVVDPAKTPPAEPSEELLAALLPKVEGRLAKPAFGAVVDAKGKVLVKAGDDPGFEASIMGFPAVADAFTGVMRDAMLVLSDKPFHVAVAPVFFSGKPVGAVMLGWSLDARYADAFTDEIGEPVVLLLGDQRVGAAAPELNGEMLAQVASGAPFGEYTPEIVLPLPLPILVADRERYVGAAQVAYPGQQDARFVVAIDRSAALDTIASLQLAVLGATLIAGFIIFLLVLNILRSISKPMQQLMNHLSQYAQGNPVGILPESALSGPFVRLGKQINMILQSPPPAQAPRGGGSPLAPPSLPKDAFDSTLVSDSRPPPPPFTDPGSPALDDDGPVSFDGIPGLGQDDAGAGGEGVQPVRAAPVSNQLADSALSGLFDEGGGSDPLAAFRVPSNGAAKPPVAPPTPPTPPTPAATPAPSGGVALPGARPPAHAAAQPTQAPPEDFNPEATAMFQVPEALLQQAAQSGVGIPAMRSTPPPSPPPAQHDEARTVIAQIPTELLNRSSGASGISAQEEAHFKDVYQEFVKTREQCGEDTDQLTYDRFLTKLMKNRQQIIEKYNSKSVRFQVYVKQGKAALRAVPVRE